MEYSTNPYVIPLFMGKCINKLSSKRNISTFTEQQMF